MIVGVPVEDRGDLEALMASIDGAAEFSQHRYIDGATYIEAITQIVFSAAAWATFREWIRARSDVKKATRVTMDGVEITAMTPKDVVRVIELIGSQQHRNDDNA